MWRVVKRIMSVVDGNITGSQESRGKKDQGPNRPKKPLGGGKGLSKPCKPSGGGAGDNGGPIRGDRDVPPSGGSDKLPPGGS
jgi:hypothetical protein